MLSSNKGGLLARMAMMVSALGNASAGGAVQEMPGRTPERQFTPYVDRVGMNHGHSGDKLVRAAFKGTVTLRHSLGPYAAWVSASVAKGWRHGRRPGYSKGRSI